LAFRAAVLLSKVANCLVQDPIVHFESDLHEVIRWADAQGRKWAFSLSNAGARYCEFRSRLDQLDQLNRSAIAATDFRGSSIKESKQAEFLVQGRLPFDLVERIGVRSAGIRARATTALAGALHRPLVQVRPEWYF
jgi:hypothetical protein